MRGIVRIAVLALSLAILLPAATLQRLSLDDLAQKSTAIVRVRALDSYAAQSNSIIYTHYRLQVVEWWKGSGGEAAEVVTPGGVVGASKQVFSGAPQLVMGGDYVLFLWKGPSGLTHIVGLSQGLFKVGRDANGQVVATREASAGPMLDPATGQAVGDRAASYSLSDLRQRVGAAIATGGAK
ncbi:MAG: hypothetical protein ACLQGV_05175 [Bryobacteraceae bacterium]